MYSPIHPSTCFLPSIYPYIHSLTLPSIHLPTCHPPSQNKSINPSSIPKSTIYPLPVHSIIHSSRHPSLHPSTSIYSFIHFLTIKPLAHPPICSSIYPFSHSSLHKFPSPIHPPTHRPCFHSSFCPTTHLPTHPSFHPPILTSIHP